MKIILYLMNQKGLQTITRIIQEGLSSSIEMVIGAEDKEIENDYYEDIRNITLSHNIPFFNRNTNPSISSNVFKLAIGWRWIINESHNLLVIHDSLLPRYRGFAPLVNALINGEEVIGATMIFAENEYDTGDIIFQEQLNITYPIKIEEAISRVATLYESMTIKLLTFLNTGETLPRSKQNESLASYSLWRDEEDYQINWHDSSERIERFINSVGYPFNGAKCYVNDKEYRILSAEQVNDVLIENRTPGKLIFKSNNHPVVVCGKGLLKITSLVDDKNNKHSFNQFRLRFK